MNRKRIAGYFVEVDHDRGTLTLYPKLAENLKSLGVLIAAVCIGCLGIFHTYMWWFGKPAAPLAPQDFFTVLGLPPMSMLPDIIMGVSMLDIAVKLSSRPITRIARGFPHFVLDRGEGVFREGNHILLDLHGVESISVKDEDDSECYRVVIHFHYKDGNSSEWSDSRSDHRESRELLAHVLADFLKIPVSGQPTVEKKLITEV